MSGLDNGHRATDVFDADMHFDEVEETWADIEPKWRAHGLRMTTDRSGRRWLASGERRLLPVRATRTGEVDEARDAVRDDADGYERMVAARRSEAKAQRRLPVRSDAAERVATLERMGVRAAWLFPSYGLFWPSLIEDAELADANFAAWNSWIARQCEIAPDRLLGVAEYSLADPDRAAAEIWRCRSLGLRGFFIPARPYRELPWGDPSNEPVWTALEQAGLPLLLHAVATGPLAYDTTWEKGIEPGHVGQPVQTFLNRALPAEAVISNLIFQGVLERHPALRIGVIEFGALWVPSFLRRLDYTFDFLGPRNRYLRRRLSDCPSAYFRRQVRVSAFWNESLPGLLGQDPELYLFSSDYPHPEGSERALQRARGEVEAVPEPVREAFFASNAVPLLDPAARDLSPVR